MPPNPIIHDTILLGLRLPIAGLGDMILGKLVPPNQR